ncbi:hypothetical protein SDC9_149850 [bioreactor metagenome]|uniref:Uncharacterized protein n=1 Tax=bioreactor metagenome TaxID=1076179 RepID=A0A645EPU9_9ZZZZ
MGELVACHHRRHANVGEQRLVVVGTGSADVEHDRTSVDPGADRSANRLDSGHFLRDHDLDAGSECRVVEVAGDLAQALGGGLRADDIHLHPRDAELGLHHLGHVVDRTMALNEVQVGIGRASDLGVLCIPAEGRHQLDTAAGQDPLDLERVTTDVVLPQ